MKIFVLLFLFISAFYPLVAQTLFVPGTIGTSTNSGNVGIGPSNSAPLAPLHISGAVPELNLLIQNTSANGARTFLTAFPFKSSIQTDMDFTISTNGGGWSDKFIVKNNGYVGVGTLAPDAKLHVHDDTPLGQATGSYHLLSRISGRGYNYFLESNWLLRDDNSSSGWTTARLHNAISIDNSFLQPGVDTKTWWERDPYNNIQSWGQGNETYMTMNGGYLGIGTTTPRAWLDIGRFIPNGALGTVFGRLQEGDGVGNGTYLGVRGYETGLSGYGGKGFSLEHSFYGSVNSSINFYRGGSTTGGFITFNTDNNVERMRITTNGNIAIGAVDPQGYKLAIAGKAIAEEIVVKLQASWPDYVFEKNYNLRPLAEVETYINQNKHLPEVPAAKEMEANGVNVGEMNMLLLKKVEELTLYVIELEKKINSLQDSKK
jgi:hypothetical protein